MLVHVAVGVIYNSSGDILIALRPDDRPLGGYWEFPGGKVEPGEEVLQALQRELKEELDITVTQATPLLQQQHRYTKNEVLLDVWQVSQFIGTPHGREGQRVTWVEPQALVDYQFPEANQAIITRILQRVYIPY